MVLLVNTIEHTSLDVSNNYQLAKRGDVLAVKRVYESWGLSEVLDPQWRIVLVPDLSEVQALSLLSGEKAPPYTPQAVLRLRAFGLNLNKLHEFNRPRAATYDQDQNVRPDFVLTASQITEATEAKSFVDVNSIGPDPHVI